MQKLIFEFKYGRKTYLRKIFFTLMTSFIEKNKIDFNQFDIIVPVPLHSTRQREREFNQSELLAKMLAQKFDKPLSVNNLIRVRFTQFQATISPKERWTNLQGAFKIKHSQEFKDKSVLVIDDLLTTGATANEIAGELKKAKAKSVSILTLASA